MTERNLATPRNTSPTHHGSSAFQKADLSTRSSLTIMGKEPSIPQRKDMRVDCLDQHFSTGMRSGSAEVVTVGMSVPILKRLLSIFRSILSSIKYPWMLKY